VYNLVVEATKIRPPVGMKNDLYQKNLRPDIKKRLSYTRKAPKNEKLSGLDENYPFIFFMWAIRSRTLLE
jgi:hypothetical protein